MKTPADLANKYLTRYVTEKANGEPASIFEAIRDAIEADRAQRHEEGIRALATYDRIEGNAALHDCVGALRNIVQGKA